MHRPRTRRSAVCIMLAGTLAEMLLGGCSMMERPLAALHEPPKAEIVQNRTIEKAEAAVLASPLDPAVRARLGEAYMAAGRFPSAAESFSAAMTLGDTTPVTALRLALALTGSGREAEAAALLFDRAEDLPAADLGLALALAGEVESAIRTMEAAIRFGESSAPLRQNLALTYALAGRWREARRMAEIDVPADRLGERMERWAAMALSARSPQRLAMVLRLPVDAADPGMPVALALAPVQPHQLAAPAMRAAPRLSAPEAAARIAAVAVEPTTPDLVRAVLQTPMDEPLVAASSTVPQGASAPAATGTTARPDTVMAEHAPPRRPGVLVRRWRLHSTGPHW